MRFDHEEGIIYGRVYREIRVLRKNIYTIIYKIVLTEREFYIFNHQNMSIAIHEHANYQDYLNRRSRRQDLIDLLLRFLDPTDTYNIAIPEADKDDRHNFLRYYVWESLLAY